MAIEGEVAKLAVDLSLTGNFASSVAKAETQLSRFGSSVSSGAAAGLGKVEKAAKSGGEALHHFQDRIGGLLGPLGIVGVVGASASLGAALEKSVEKASDMGFAVEKLTALTGESADKISSLAFVVEKFGIDATQFSQIVGFTEKTLGKLTQTTVKHGVATSKALDLQKRYGVAITDAKGHALDFSTVLNHVADYYTSNAAASDKAALAATVFGRGYAKLIPVLALGSKGIRDAEEAAKELGLTLTNQNLKDLSDFRKATRETGEAVGGLELQLGLVLIPTIKDVANTITHFLAHGGREQLVGFFKSGLATAQAMAGFITGTVLPTLHSLADAALGAWNSIPAPLRDLLARGIIADRTIHFLFGISPIKIAVDFAEQALAKVVGSIGGAIAGKVGAGLVEAGIGKAFVQPVFVTNPGFGGAVGAAEGAAGAEAGAAGAAGAGSSILGRLSGIVMKVAIVGMVAEVADLIHGAISPGGGLEGRTQSGNLLPGDQLQWPFGPKGTPHIDIGPFHNILGGDSTFTADAPALEALTAKVPVAGPETNGVQAGAILDRGGRERGFSILANTIHVGNVHLVAELSSEYRTLGGAIKTLASSRSGDVIRKSVADLERVLVHEGRGSVANTKNAILSLKEALSHTHDPKLQAVLRAALKDVEGKLPGREFAARELAKADKIIGGTKSTADKIKELEAIERDLKDHKLPGQTAKLQAKIDALKASQAAKQAETTAAIKDKKESLSVSFAPKIVVNSRYVTVGQTRYNAYFQTGTVKTR